IIPKPFDPRVLMTVAPAVAKAAMDSKVALAPIEDLKAYRDKLESLGSISRGFVRGVINKVHANRKRTKKDVPIIVFPEGNSNKVLKAVASVQSENIMRPVLLGYPEQVRTKIRELDLEDAFENVPIVQTSQHKNFSKYVERFYDERK